MKSIFLTALILAGSSSAFAGNILVNGSFETGDFTGWTFNNGDAQVCSILGPYCVASDGNYAADFNAGNTTPNASISQSFASTAGEAFDLSFEYLSGNQTLDVYVDDGGTLGDILTTTASASGNVYTPFTFTFEATSNLTTLTLVDDPSNDTYDNDGLLDAVSVSPSTPEPASFLLIGGGMLAVSLLVRRRKAQA